MQVRKTYRPAALAQLDRVFGYEPKGQGFESLTPRQKSRYHLWYLLFCCHTMPKNPRKRLRLPRTRATPQLQI